MPRGSHSLKGPAGGAVNGLAKIREGAVAFSSFDPPQFRFVLGPHPEGVGIGQPLIEPNSLEGRAPSGPLRILRIRPKIPRRGILATVDIQEIFAEGKVWRPEWADRVSQR
jgi:hypothetical protein